jgi:hypothetical protein
MCACVVANFFGDRWTYLEITGLLWVIVAAAIRATEFTALQSATEATQESANFPKNPYMAYR